MVTPEFLKVEWEIVPQGETVTWAFTFGFRKLTKYHEMESVTGADL